MTKLQKIRQIVLALIMIASAIYFIISPTEAYVVLILILGIWLIIRGLGTLTYYFLMARFMVGGKSSLYMGIIMLDMGILACSLNDVPHYYIFIYLIIVHAFSGLIEILRAFEARRFGSSAWKLKFAHGILNLVMTLLCIIYIKHMSAAVVIYGIALLYSAVMMIISAFRKTRFIYIQ